MINELQHHILPGDSYAFIYKHGQSASKQMKAHNPNDMYLELAVVSNFFSKADPAHICNAWQSL